MVPNPTFFVFFTSILQTAKELIDRYTVRVKCKKTAQIIVRYFLLWNTNVIAHNEHEPSVFQTYYLFIQPLYQTLRLDPRVHIIIWLRGHIWFCVLLLLTCQTKQCRGSRQSAASTNPFDRLPLLLLFMCLHTHTCIYHYSLGRISSARWGTSRILRGLREGQTS